MDVLSWSTLPAAQRPHVRAPALPSVSVTLPEPHHTHAFARAEEKYPGVHCRHAVIWSASDSHARPAACSRRPRASICFCSSAASWNRLALACESEQQHVAILVRNKGPFSTRYAYHVAILVRNKGLSRLDNHNMW